MSKEKITFGDLHWTLKFAIAGGFTYMVLFIIGFISGFAGAL